MDRKPRFPPERLGESLDAADLGPRLFPLQTERDAHDHGGRFDLERDLGDRRRRVAHGRDPQGAKRRREGPVRIAHREPELAESEIHA